MIERFLYWLSEALFKRQTEAEAAKAADRLCAAVEELQDEIRRGAA